MENIGHITTIEACIQEGRLRFRVEFSRGQSVVVTSRCLRNYEAFRRHVKKELGGRYFYRAQVTLLSCCGGVPLRTVPPLAWEREASERIGLATPHIPPDDPDPERGYLVEL